MMTDARAIHKDSLTISKRWDIMKSRSMNLWREVCMITYRQMYLDLKIRRELGEQLKQTPEEVLQRAVKEGVDSEYRGPEEFKGATRPRPTGIFAKIY
jgi:hypothetical protein